ncbi:MAG TPA: hypothetical protein VJO33_06775 [Gemmatimonadaceae bacterium]|nr:hypothetical protein [Gemmatimonadaceae bacterium]
MLVRLRDIPLTSFVEQVFAHAPPADDAKPWYFGDVRFEVEPIQQLRHLTDLFSSADSLPDYGLSNAQIGEGLWCILGGAHNWAFVSLVWDPAIPIALRRATIDALFNLYDRLLAATPYEAIDFRQPDYPPRRFQTIDYMALALVVEAITPSNSTPYDRTRIRSALLSVLGRLLDHSSPVAQYAALHGLGHLRTKRRVEVIDRYLVSQPAVDGAQREYALDARAGTLL